MIYNTNLHLCIPTDSQLAIWDGTSIHLICRNKYIHIWDQIIKTQRFEMSFPYRKTRKTQKLGLWVSFILHAFHC